MGYEDHGLTREEDGILGAFGQEANLQEEVLTLDYLQRSYPYSARTQDAVKSLLKRGLLHATISKELGIELGLTRKGIQLWNIRSQEELHPVVGRIGG